eukprot:SAG22_NODE_17021_length_313_cov_0.658879_1_plen_87_part_10
MRQIRARQGGQDASSKCTEKQLDQAAAQFVSTCGETMDYLQKQIQQGAKNFLNTEYKYLAGFVFVVALALGLLFTFFDDDNPLTPSG